MSECAKSGHVTHIANGSDWNSSWSRTRTELNVICKHTWYIQTYYSSWIDIFESQCVTPFGSWHIEATRCSETRMTRAFLSNKIQQSLRQVQPKIQHQGIYSDSLTPSLKIVARRCLFIHINPKFRLHLAPFSPLARFSDEIQESRPISDFFLTTPSTDTQSDASQIPDCSTQSCSLP